MHKRGRDHNQRSDLFRRPLGDWDGAMGTRNTGTPPRTPACVAVVS
jgi:hypothetical protein